MNNAIRKQDKIYIAGHRGMVGSALQHCLVAKGYTQLVTRSHTELDLCRQTDVDDFFASERPAHVFMAAARVGGILANSQFGADFIRDNLAMTLNVIDAAYRHGVRKLLYLGSSCIYPKLAPQPLREEYLLSGVLEATNEPYAIAKIAGIKLCSSYNRQYGTDFMAIMPTNLYGSGDNYDRQTSHVLPALIRKMHEAKINGDSCVTVWGTGTPMREFLFSEDLAEACVFLMEKHSAAEIGELINIGTGKDISIAQLARLIADIVGYQGGIEFDAAKPDGTPRKLLDISRMNQLGWQASTSLEDGIRRTYDYFLSAHADH